MNTPQNSAYLEIIIGPMFASKTSKLIEIYKQYKFCGLEPIVINHSHDTRYSLTELTSHDSIKIPCIMISKLEEFNCVENYEVILINEGQFFEDLVDNVKRYISMKKKNIHIRS